MDQQITFSIKAANHFIGRRENFGEGKVWHTIMSPLQDFGIMLAFKHLWKKILYILGHYFREIFQKLKTVDIICKLQETDQNVLTYTQELLSKKKKKKNKKMISMYNELVPYSEIVKTLKIKQSEINGFIQGKDNLDINHIGSMNELSKRQERNDFQQWLSS